MEEGAAESRTVPEGESRHSRGWRILLLLFGMLAAYPLSSGPAAALYNRGVIPQQFLAVYRPLGILCDHSRLAERFFRWYFEAVSGGRLY